MRSVSMLSQDKRGCHARCSTLTMKAVVAVTQMRYTAGVWRWSKMADFGGFRCSGVVPPRLHHVAPGKTQRRCVIPQGDRPAARKASIAHAGTRRSAKNRSNGQLDLRGRAEPGRREGACNLSFRRRPRLSSGSTVSSSRSISIRGLMSESRRLAPARSSARGRSGRESCRRALRETCACKYPVVDHGRRPIAVPS